MKIVLKNDGKSKSKKFFFDNYEKGMDIDPKATAKELNVSYVTIYNWMKEINSK